MTNLEISRLFKHIAAAYEIKGENRFRVLAYEKAAESVANLPAELSDLWKEGKLTGIEGIGSTFASHLDELFKTGTVKHFESVLSDLPVGMFVLLDVPGFGPKKAFKLSKEFHLGDPKTAVQKLLEAAQSGKIAPLPGFGEISQSDIIEAIKQYKRGQFKENRMPLPYASAIGFDVLSYLTQNKYVIVADVLGSLRRKVATIGDIDIAVATRKPEDVLDYFIQYPKKAKLIERGPTGASILVSSGRQVDLRVISPDQYGSMIQYFTGSKAHNIKLREYALKKGLSLNEYGIRPIKKNQKSKIKDQKYNAKLKIFEFAKEAVFYKFLGLPWIPPELREDKGEIEASLTNKAPNLVQLKDIKGEFHIHSNYDLKSSHDTGSSSVAEIMKTAYKRGYEYVGIADHNPKISGHTKEDIISIMKRRKEHFEKQIYSTKSVRVQLLIMLETDILPDGKLALPAKAFDYLDATIVSIHSNFNLNKVEMTRRVLRGLSHPKAKILAHPTGRLLGKRDGFELDWEQVFLFCKKYDKALEINSYPDRLDIADTVVYEAVREGVKMVIDTDSHDKSQMDLIEYGVSVARRGWAEKADILNTMPYNEVKEWLQN